MDGIDCQWVGGEQDPGRVLGGTLKVACERVCCVGSLAVLAVPPN